MKKCRIKHMEEVHVGVFRWGLQALWKSKLGLD